MERKRENAYKKAVICEMAVLDRVALTEVRIEKNRADVVIVSPDTRWGYEIKTEKDTFSRLQSQVKAYFDVFDFVSVVVSQDKVDKVLKIIPDTVGVLVFSKGCILTIREPKRNIPANPAVLFDTLRQPEYKVVVSNRIPMDQLEAIPNTKIYSLCKKVFGEMCRDGIADKFVNKVLMKR